MKPVRREAAWQRWRLGGHHEGWWGIHWGIERALFESKVRGLESEIVCIYAQGRKKEGWGLLCMGGEREIERRTGVSESVCNAS